MKFLHRRRFSSALVRDSNLADGLFVALIVALRCLRSAIALTIEAFRIQQMNKLLARFSSALRCLRSAIVFSVAVFFIQRMHKHRSEKTAAGISPASHGALAGLDKANYLSQIAKQSKANESKAE